ncbi:hypothetical protein ACFPFX_10880 [Streptomyces mauvecolor]|uniref:Uncharacterized protein n=1 Tax=Streptomyces mauvecolor TaxID=58345 RepID=A0ABV9UN43_9ACTN
MKQGFALPFTLIGDLADAVSGRNGGAGAFLDKYFPIRPAYQLYRASFMFFEQGCKELSDLYSKAGDQLAQQILLVGLGGLSGWMRGATGAAGIADEEAGAAAAASVDSAAAGMADTSRPVALLGRVDDIDDYIAANPAEKLDRLSVQGNMAKGKKGVGSWNWTRNKRYIDDALANGELRLVTNPDDLSWRWEAGAAGNGFQRELKYLQDKGYTWLPVHNYWLVVRARP